MTDGIFRLECWVVYFVVLFNFLFPSFNWKDLFGQDLGGAGRPLLVG